MHYIFTKNLCSGKTSDSEFKLLRIREFDNVTLQLKMHIKTSAWPMNCGAV